MGQEHSRIFHGRQKRARRSGDGDHSITATGAASFRRDATHQTL
jgi:hypothetical protein